MRRLLAVQAQDDAATRLALRARSTGLTAAGVERSLAGGELVVAWLLRGTLHLVARADHGWLLSLTAPRAIPRTLRRLHEEGVAPEAAEALGALVREAGAIGRREAGERLGLAGQGLAHAVALAALRGAVVLGADRALVPAPPPAAPVDRDAALAELGRRYLAGHAPAGDRDLAAWSGVGLRDARRALAGARAAAPPPPAPEAPVPPRLLGAFDPYLLGWADRGFAVPPALARVVHPGGGILRRVAVDDGRVVGTWDDVTGDGRFAAERADLVRFAAGA